VNLIPLSQKGTSVTELVFTIETRAGRSERTIRIDRLIIAGWTGRDRAKMEAHIAELQAIGVKRPAATPTFYRVSAARLTTAALIEVPGTASSGEAEALLINADGKIYVGLASDHTEREVEAYGITVSKQMCDKPCATVLWPLAELASHWDDIGLSARIAETGAHVEYQRGKLSAMLSPDDLIKALEGAGGAFTPGTAMLCGTLAAIGGVRAAPRFEMTLTDPVLGRSISHGYDIVSLPVAG